MSTSVCTRFSEPGRDHRSKSVCCSWGLALVFSQCLGLSLFVDKRMLWDKWFSTCPSKQKDERWEKKQVRDGEWGNDGSFQRNCERSRRVKKQRRGERKKFKREKGRVALKENLWFSSGPSHSSSPCEQFSPGKWQLLFQWSCLPNTASQELRLAFGPRDQTFPHH